MFLLLTIIANTGRLSANDVGAPETELTTASLDGVLSTVYAIAGIMAVIAIIFAGYIYTASNGEVDKIRKAKNIILYAVIGLVVVMLAFVITQFVLGKV